MPIATPRTWVVGEVVTAAQMNAEIRDQITDLIAPWVSYTPSWTATTTNPVVGNGSITGRYKLIGKTCIAMFEIVCGTTTTFGSGTWAFSLPFTVASPAGTSANWVYCGSARGHNASQWVTGTVGALKGTATARIYSHEHSAEWSASQPHVWTAATSNYFEGQVTFETA